MAFRPFSLADFDIILSRRKKLTPAPPLRPAGPTPPWSVHKSRCAIGPLFGALCAALPVKGYPDGLAGQGARSARGEFRGQASGSVGAELVAGLSQRAG